MTIYDGQCDYHIASDDRCTKDGLYGYPDWEVSEDFPIIDRVIRDSTWCEDHKRNAKLLYEEEIKGDVE